MKNILIILFAFLVVTGCKNDKRYFAESAEIKTILKGISAYESGDWETWKSHFADTAKIYVNSTKSVSVEQREKDLRNAVSTLSSYSFDKKEEFVEMVVDKDDETWVYYWSTWNGETKANKKISVPVHIAARFQDSKIVTEHIYFDATVFDTGIRYTQKSSEIESSKSVIKSYDTMDWETLASHYADSAKVYFNTTEKNPMLASKLPEYHKANDQNYTSRGFVKGENEFEMVVTDKGDTWVNFWGTWKGKLKTNGKEIEVPVHMTSKYVNGKIVEEHGFWDASEIVLELQPK